MKITIQTEISVGQLLFNLMEEQGIVMNKSVGPREEVVTVGPEYLEPVAEKFVEMINSSVQKTQDPQR